MIIDSEKIKKLLIGKKIEQFFFVEKNSKPGIHMKEIEAFRAGNKNVVHVQKQPIKLHLSLFLLTLSPGR